MFCRNCGQKLESHHKICPSCGSKVEDICAENKNRYSYLYNHDSGGVDVFSIKKCTEGQHEFIAYVTHNPSCVGTMPQVFFRCKKCSRLYLGIYPYRYGDVVSEEY